MFVRATTISADPSRIDELIQFVSQEVTPALDGLRGSLGLSMFVDRQTGTSTVSTAWQTVEDRAATESVLAPLRNKAAGLFDVQPLVELFEMAVLDRRRPAEPGFWARMTRVSMDPARVDEGIDTYGTTTLPALELLDGFCSAVLLVDRDSGAGVSSVVFDGRASLEASREQGEQIRRTTSAKAGAEIVEVREAEIVIAGIRVPQSG